MRYEDLTAEDQELVNTDFGDFDKEASEKLAEANEVYAYGQEQGLAVADQMDEAMAKFASEDEEDKEEDKEEELDEESEKKAAELGAFIERGFFDELTKLGSERHDDPTYYYYPYMEEKVAQMGAEEKVAGWREAIKETAGKVKELAKSKAKEPAKKLSPLEAVGAKGKAHRERGLAAKGVEKVKDYHKGMAGQITSGAKKLHSAVTPSKGIAKTKYMREAAAKGGAKDLAKGVAKGIPHAAILAGTGYTATKK